MARSSFSDADFAAKARTNRKERFLAEMEQVVPSLSHIRTTDLGGLPGGQEWSQAVPVGDNASDSFVAEVLLAERSGDGCIR